jgi:hypothetical protein
MNSLTLPEFLFYFHCEIHTYQTEEQMLLWKRIPTHTTGEGVFNLSDLYIAEKGLSWK